MSLSANLGQAFAAQAETDKRVLEDSVAQARAPQEAPRVSCMGAGHPYSVVARC